MTSSIEVTSNFQYDKYTGFTENFGKFLRFLKRIADYKIKKMIWGPLQTHIYENPLKTEVDLFARKTSVW